MKRLIGRLSPLSAGQILDGIDVEGTIAEIMKKGSLSLKQRTLADLMDRAWGRPAQAVSVSGAVVHAHWTPSNCRVPGTSQDGRGFQEKLTVAIEAEVMASEGENLSGLTPNGILGIAWK